MRCISAFDVDTGAKLMTIGLSTYAFFWQWHDTAENPLTLPAMIDRTADLGVSLFQICDYPLLESYEPDDLDGLRNHAAHRNVQLELGTRGVRPEQLRRYLKIARRLDATMLRTMINTSDHRPSPAEAISLLASAAPAFKRAGVTIALETYEQIPVATLVDIVRRVDSPAVGICVDPANCVAALELPTATVEAVAPYVCNIHVKDFAFSRRDGWVGFSLAGCPLARDCSTTSTWSQPPGPPNATSAKSSSTGCPGKATAPALSAPRTSGISTTSPT
jgi:3-oxoisoapionate decarboxylase